MAMSAQTTKDGNIAWIRVNELLVVASGNRPITDSAWQEYLEQTSVSVQTDGPFKGLLLWWPLNAPSSGQRSMLVEKYAEKIRLDMQRRAAVVAESLLIRGAMTAIGWFSKGETVVKPFSPADPKLVFDWLAEEVKFDPQEAEEARLRAIAACTK